MWTLLQKLFLWEHWEFCRMYFHHALPPPPSIFTSSYSPSHHLRVPPFFFIMANLCCQNILWCVTFHLNTVNLAGSPLLERNWPSLSQKLNIAKSFLGRHGICTQLPFDSGICYTTSLHRFCVCCHSCLSACVQLLHRKTVFPWDYPPPLALRCFLLFLLKWSLGLCQESCDT